MASVGGAAEGAPNFIVGVGIALGTFDGTRLDLSADPDGWLRRLRRIRRAARRARATVSEAAVHRARRRAMSIGRTRLKVR